MPSLSDYERVEYWASAGWMAPWLKTVDPSYWREMVPCIGEHWVMRKAMTWQEWFLTEEGHDFLRKQLVVRLSQASVVLVPWMAQALKMDGLRVLEIGCGSGSSTAGLARAGAKGDGVRTSRGRR